MSHGPDGARLRVDDFDYRLPASAIAQIPAEPRDAARLLILDRGGSRPGRPKLTHSTFAQLGDALRGGDLLVANDSRVIRARLPATRSTGGAAEVLMLRPMEDGSGRWEALVRPSRRIAVGDPLTLRSGDTIEVGERLGGGTRAVRFARDPLAVMETAGEMPLPPYIRDRSSRRRSATRPSMPDHPARRPRRPPGCISREACWPTLPSAASDAQP